MFSILNQPPSASTPNRASRPNQVGRRVPWYRSPKLIRHGVMVFFFLFLLRVAYHHMVLGGGPNGTPSVEAYCPFGGIETMYQFVTTGGFVRRIEPSALILMAAVVLLTIVASRGFCGWICPFGSLQEWIGILGRKLLGKRFNPTGTWDRALRPFKYIVLVTIVTLTWWTGSLVFRDYDPFLAFFHLGDHLEELKWAYSILGIVLVGSLFIERFFCKYACPLGAVIGVLGKIGITRIERDTQDCKECNLCQKRCPAHVEFLPHTVIRSAECNHCLDCVVDCPKPNVLSVRGLKLRFSHATYAVVLLGGFFGLIGISQLSGKWQTKPERLVATDNQGILDAGAIRGWMSLREISTSYGIPLEQLYRGTGLPSTVPPDTRINKVGEEFKEGFTPESAREFVDSYLAARPAATPGGASASAAPAAESRAARVAPETSLVPKDVAEAPESRTAPAGSASNPALMHAARVPSGQAGNPDAGARRGKGNGEGDGAGGSKAHPEGQEPEVKGFMTLNEIVLKTGVPKSFLLERLGLPGDIPGTQPVRSWMHDKGKTIADLRDAVEAWRAQRKP